MTINFIQRYKVQGNCEVTHTVIPYKNETEPLLKFGCKLFVPSNDLKYFNKKCLQYFKTRNIPLTESFREYSPLIFDIDLNYTNNLNYNRYYTKNTLKRLNELFIKYINIYFYVDSTECWIFERTKGSLETKLDITYIKEGLHIIYPDIIGHTSVFKHFLNTINKIPDFQIELIELFESTSINNIKPDNSVEKIIDGNVNRWFVYGCGKNDKPPYLLTNIIHDNKFIDYNLDDITILNKISLLQEFEINISYKNNIDVVLNNYELKTSNSVSTFEMFDSEDEELDDDYDPYFTIVEEKQNKRDAIRTINDSERTNIESMVLNCLSVERASEYEQWIRVGMCLRNIGGDKLFDLFDEYSQKSENYEGKDECRKYWNGFKREGLTIGSLHYWAKRDNIEEYRKIIYNNLKNIIEKTIDHGGMHDDVANVVHGRFKDEFICVDLKDHWLYFDGNKWIHCQKGYRLQKYLTGEVKEIFYQYHKMYKEKMDDLISDEKASESETMDKYQKKAYMIYTKLKDVSYQKNIMESCKIKFHEEKMMEKMDSKTHLLGFDNCVVDLSENIVREGRPEDFISMTNKLELPVKECELPLSIDDLSNIVVERVGKYKINDNKQEVWDIDKWDDGNSQFYDKIRHDIKKFFREILPDPEIKKYCLRFIASRLCGDVLDQRFSMWTGVGGNGKSILIDLIRHTFGEYAINLPVTLLTQKRKASNSASPEKARCRGVRICYLQEPDSNEKINAGEMKELTGGDMIQARKLYGDVFEFKPQFELVLMCNELPTIDDKSQGSWRRVQVYPFISRFVDDNKDVDHEKHIYLKDKQLQKKTEKWPIVFIVMLLKEWESMDGGINEDEIPDSIRMQTESYKNQNDMIGSWISEDLEIIDTDPVPFNILFNAFSNWHSENYSNGKVDQVKVKKRLIDWQRKSRFDFVDGINGNERYPKFNLKPVEEC